ncbi:hypothetical protein CK203_055799 [Vitis vinifera]|uniref:Uncharacterized protein n=1 Tax=Vitis vinifera TaxID=29760 RepID=A0A438H662_VITVI|nr:hypothetical protein CK203_055799 [Vitis vinifera]
MTRIRGGHTDSSLSCNPRPRASSPQDSTTQALEASTIPSSEGGVPSNPSQRRYETRIPLTTPEVTSSRPESSPRGHATAAGTSGFISTAPEVPSRAPYDSQGVLLPRVALDFYQSMTTHDAWSPTAIHFSIDGR